MENASNRNSFQKIQPACLAAAAGTCARRGAGPGRRWRSAVARGGGALLPTWGLLAGKEIAVCVDVEGSRVGFGQLPGMPKPSEML